MAHFYGALRETWEGDVIWEINLALPILFLGYSAEEVNHAKPIFTVAHAIVAFTAKGFGGTVPRLCQMPASTPHVQNCSSVEPTSLSSLLPMMQKGSM